MITEQIKKAIRDIPDFPKPGIIFKDITPILKDPALCDNITNAFVEQLKGVKIDVIVGIESRGFLFAAPVALLLGKPCIPLRKAGKLPGPLHAVSYALEYGDATLEIQRDAFAPGARVLIVDDVLATGGTAAAAGRLVDRAAGVAAGRAHPRGWEALVCVVSPALDGGVWRGG